MAEQDSKLPAMRQVPASRGSQWWSDGWQLFKASPGTWIAIVVVWVVINLALMQVGTIGNLVATVMTPVFAAGILLGARAQDAGAPLRFEHLFAGFGGGHFGPLLQLGLLNLLLTAAVTVVVGLVALLFVDSGTVLQMLNPDVTALMDVDVGALIPLLLVIMPLMAIGLLLVGIAMWFAPGLVAVQKVGAWSAMKLSFAITFRNVGALLMYDLILVAFALVATIPLGLGWLVLGPTLAASWYASWRDLFGDTPAVSEPVPS